MLSPLIRRVLLPSMLALLAAHSHAAGSCIDESSVELQEGAKSAASVPPQEPRLQLQSLVRTAIQRSQAVGAAKLLAEAAQYDIEETRAARKPQVFLNGVVGQNGSTLDGIDQGSGRQARASISISSLLFDAGRTDRMTDWRRQLAEAARQGQLTAEEQIALQTVSLALERNRYKLQSQVYQQYMRKMSCLVEALGQIVQVDHGRMSELVQARKTAQQAQIAAEAADANVRQMEVRLRRFVGDTLPPLEGVASVFTRIPSTEEIVAAAERSAEMQALSAQANAAQSYADAVASGTKPQVSWSVSGSKAGGLGNPAAWGANVNISVPLYDPGADPRSRAAQERAEAARLQRADALEARKSRVFEVHEQASTAFDQARRIAQVLRDSDRVREFTLQQWQQLGRRSLFDVMAAEGDHYNLRISYVNALYDAQEADALMVSLGAGLKTWLQ